MESHVRPETRSDISGLKLNTSYVTPLTLQKIIDSHYLPVFIVRNISNSTLIGKYSNTAVHCKELSPSNELFNSWKNNEINTEVYHKRYAIEVLNNVDFDQVFWKLGQLAKISNATGIIFFGYGRDFENCHRKVLSELINGMSIFNHPIKELIM